MRSYPRITLTALSIVLGSISLHTLASAAFPGRILVPSFQSANDARANPTPLTVHRTRARRHTWIHSPCVTARRCGGGSGTAGRLQATCSGPRASATAAPSLAVLRAHGGG